MSQMEGTSKWDNKQALQGGEIVWQHIVGERIVIRGIGARTVTYGLQRILLREVRDREQTCVITVRRRKGKVIAEGKKYLS